jgi:hypothetical protein
MVARCPPTAPLSSSFTMHSTLHVLLLMRCIRNTAAVVLCHCQAPARPRGAILKTFCHFAQASQTAVIAFFLQRSQGPMAALAQTPPAPPRVRSIVQHDLHLFSSSFLTKPTNFTKLSTEFQEKVSTGVERRRSLENDLADAGIVVRMADKERRPDISRQTRRAVDGSDALCSLSGSATRSNQSCSDTVLLTISSLSVEIGLRCC